MIDFSLYETYLISKLGMMYVYGAQGQKFVDLLDKLVAMEGRNADKINNVLVLLQKKLEAGESINELEAYDCSGLFMAFALKYGIFKNDMQAKDIYNAIPNKIALKDVQAGDFVFTDSLGHIGYAISNTEVIEARGTAYGVVMTVLKNRDWAKAARPYWWSDIQPAPVPVLTRELYYTNPMMRGNDVEMVQDRLADLKYDCGTADGIFGEKTKNAVIKFQKDNELKADGIVGQRTALKLGFEWRG